MEENRKWLNLNNFIHSLEQLFIQQKEMYRR